MASPGRNRTNDARPGPVPVPRPRNHGPGDRFTVGDRNGSGELSGGPRDEGVWVNCLRGTGVTVYLTEQEAEEFGLWLIESARAVRSARPSAQPSSRPAPESSSRP